MANTTRMIALLVVTQCLEVGLSTMSKAAMSRGMNDFIFVFYANFLALFILIPLTFIYHNILIFSQTPPSPNLSFSIICRIFLLGLISCSLQTLAVLGIEYSSPALSSAMGNLSIAYTFILAIIFRMEKLDLKTKSSQAKIIGTLLSIGGALVVTLYKGPTIIFQSSSVSNRDLLLQMSNWVIGGILLAIAFFIKSIMYIVQTWIIKEYPAELMVTMINCIVVTIISAIICLIAVEDPNAWNLRPDIELVAIGYYAIYGVIIRFVVHMWTFRLKGPVFFSIFLPLEMVIAVAMGIMFLGDPLSLGSVVGITTIAAGFYLMMWGKAKEEKTVDHDTGLGHYVSSSDHIVPLLQSS